MKKSKVGVIQTINYIESFEHAKEICKLIKESDLEGIRVNLCKYKRSVVGDVIRNYIRMFNENGINKIYLDVPYPVDKARVYGLSNARKDICKGKKYLIKKGINSNYVMDRKDNIIYVNCNKIEVRQDIIYYGDGEGAFKVLAVTNESVSCVALNDFYIINGKSISCGFYYQDKDTLCEILESLNGMNATILIPFVETSQQVVDIKKLTKDRISLLAKIETSMGLRNAVEISENCDGLLIGRGDIALYSDIKSLLPSIRNVISGTNKKIIFCTGILNEFNDNYMPIRAELFDLLLIRELCADEIILSGSIDFNADKIHELYSHNLQSINKKVGFIRNVW